MGRRLGSNHSLTVRGGDCPDILLVVRVLVICLFYTAYIKTVSNKRFA